MAIFDEGLLVMRCLLGFGDVLAGRAGADWGAVRATLVSKLTTLAQAPDDELEERLTILFDFLEQGPVAEVTGPLMIQARALAHDPDHHRTIEFFNPTGDKSRVVKSFRMERNIEIDWPAALRGAADTTASAVGAAEPGLDLVGLVTDPGGEDIVVPDVVGAEFPADGAEELQRHLNAGFFEAHADRMIRPSEALSLDHGPYRVGVNVGSFWGPGTPGEGFPDTLLDPVFEAQDQEHLTCDVVLFSHPAAVTPPKKSLILPRTGDSQLVFFDIEFSEGGRRLVNVHLLYRGNLLQSRQLVFDVVGGATGTAPGTELDPPQDGFVIFTRSRELSLDAIEHTAPRVVTIIVGRVHRPPSDVVALQILREGAPTEVHGTTLATEAIASRLTSVRSALIAAMNAYGGVGGSHAVLASALGRLADVGQALHADLFGDAPSSVADLPAGAVVQIAPLSQRLSVPWEVVYERTFQGSSRRGTRLCAAFLEHGPDKDDCPHADDVGVVCPYGFWGYRYVVEQLPGRVDPLAAHARREIDGVIPNGDRLSIATVVSDRLNYASEHIERLKSLAPQPPLDIVPIRNVDEARLHLGSPGLAAHVLYFYTHGGRTHANLPYLEVGDFEMTRNAFNAWKVQLLVRPLVFINACESAGYTPDDAEDLVSEMLTRGAIGAIATQCDVKELLAGDVAGTFFGLLLKGSSVGEALYRSRIELLRRLDPRGLAYSLFASADIALARRVA